MIELTVGLPIWEMEEIAWLAFESLCRQQNIDFEWELLIVEENENVKNYVGGDTIEKEYKKRLEKIGCSRIQYFGFSEKVSLIDKWQLMGSVASPHSQMFLIQAGDCFSQPYRLKETYDIFKKEDPDWVDSPKGCFWDIPSDALALYSAEGLKIPTNLNMAIKMCYTRNIASSVLHAGIDGYLKRHVKRSCDKEGKTFSHVYNTSDNWCKGFDSNGFNKISVTRLSRIKNPSGVFMEADREQFEKNVDSDILDRARGLVKRPK